MSVDQDQHRDNHSSNPAKKSKLKILSGGRKARARDHGGSPPDPTMPASRYVVKIESAKPIKRWRRDRIEFSYRVVKGDYFGTVLPGWLDIEYVPANCEELRISPFCQYFQACVAVLGNVAEGDDIDWNTVFVGKILDVEARYRTTNGKSRAPEDGTIRKDDKDFLRVLFIWGLGKI